MRHLFKNWGVGIASFVETQADWRHASEGQQFDNRFAHGLDRHSVGTYNTTVRKSYSSRNQIGRMTMVTFGRVVFSMRGTGRDKTKLGKFCWTKLVGSGKITNGMTM